MPRLFTRRCFLFLPATVAFAKGARMRLDPSMPVTFSGIGPVRIGMTATQLSRIVAGKEEPSEVLEECGYFQPRQPGIAFMLLDGQVARVDVLAGNWHMLSGARVGSTEAEIRRWYPHLQVQPHPYLDEGQGYYWIVNQQSPRWKGYQAIFESEEGKVTSFRAGQSEATGLIEGCV